jgi:hypothetical protein
VSKSHLRWHTSLCGKAVCHNDLGLGLAVLDGGKRRKGVNIQQPRLVQLQNYLQVATHCRFPIRDI